MGQQQPGQIVDTVLRSALTSIVQYCAAEDTKRELEAKVVAPLLQHLAARFAWVTRLFHWVAALLAVQTLLLLGVVVWLALDWRRRA